MLRKTLVRHPAFSYFALTFAISWGGILAIVGPTNVFASKEVFLSYVWVPPLVLGPTIAGLVMTAVVGGRRGLREFRKRLFAWRVSARWYAAALLIAPLYYVATSFVLSIGSPELLPNIVTADDKASLLVQGIIVALSAGIFEELGWTGFATPTLLRRHSPLATGFILGFLWGVWHVLPETLGARAFEFMPYLALQLVMVVVGLTAFRILMVWVYERTQSLLIGILMHTSLTASLMLLQPQVTGKSLLVTGGILDLVPWLIVVAVALFTHRPLWTAGGQHA